MAERLGSRVFANSVFNFISVAVNRVGALIFTIILIILTIGNFGIDEALTRYVSANYEKKPGKARAYFAYLFKLKTYILLASVIFLIILAKPIAAFYGNQELSFPLIVSALYLFLMSLSQFFSSLFYTFQKVKIYTIKETIFQVSRIALLPIIFILTVSLWVSGVFLILALSSVITLIFSLFILAKKYKFLFIKNEVKMKKSD